MGDRLKLTPTESVEIRSSTEAALEVEATYGAGAKPPPKHLHPGQDERFEVLSGTIQVKVDGEQRPLAAGEEIEVPRGAVHQIWNPSAEPARVLWRTSPGARTEQWFRAIDRLHREGRVGGNGMPGPLAFGVYLTEYRDVFRLAGPDWLLRPAFAGLAPIGRARGYSA
ncbi:MAG TPA: cupin domain-containing protein [Solirubrobacterales bacterium]|nr:cupin domain-containing protein [Solirubrobacterales bacterium]